MKAAVDGQLSEDQIASFHERGYIVVDFSLDQEMLDQIVEKVYPLYDEAYHQNPQAPARVQDAWKTIDEVRRLATDSRIAVALEQLLKRKPLPFQTLNFPIGTRQHTHSDSVHFSTIPKGFMAGVWVALEDIDENNGPLSYYPGSHKLREYSMQDFNIEPGVGNYQEYEECIQQLVDDEGLKPELGLLKKGEALIWHANLLHGGAAQEDLSRTRHSQVTHFYFEGCQYYTPMESTEDKPRFRHPYWIPNTPDFKLPEDRPFPIRVLIRVLNRLGIRGAS
ncbi:MAG: phytanoyl-CoA dioxygenase [SAR86 cluster bacterium]|uniref:Phytanoyl-CoA dioxygenase n=1 Tax=SAR86 cluster bacterium TaxID=2030880 RepID=A0A2A5AW12_9GAMM|nr:MAG: phytanoyl-CoA dioxygenase [SAR86 cluster bacterium]